MCALKCDMSLSWPRMLSSGSVNGPALGKSFHRTQVCVLLESLKMFGLWDFDHKVNGSMLFPKDRKCLKGFRCEWFWSHCKVGLNYWRWPTPSVSDLTGMRHKSICVSVWPDEMWVLLIQTTGPTSTWENVTLLWISIEVWFESQGNNLPFCLVSVTICWLILKTSWRCHLG